MPTATITAGNRWLPIDLLSRYWGLRLDNSDTNKARKKGSATFSRLSASVAETRICVNINPTNTKKAEIPTACLNLINLLGLQNYLPAAVFIISVKT
jgi:superfamily II RNA helicase